MTQGQKSGGAAAEAIRPGDRIVITIKRIGINGEGIGYYKKKAVFIPGALPGEVIRADVDKVEPTWIQASIAEIEKTSPDRIQPPCPVYDACGGCQLQHLRYEGQLKAKEDMVREAFSRYAGLAELPLRPIMGADHPWAYRNKAQLQLGSANGRIIAGLYSPASRRLVDISGCPIQQPQVNRAADLAKEALEQLRIPVYDERRKSGVVRTVVVRVGSDSGQIQLTFVTAGRHMPKRDELVALLRRRLPQVVTIAQNINAQNTPLIFGEETIRLWGSERIDASLRELRFSLSPRAFFQLNPAQTVKLYDAVKAAAQLSGVERVIDAYCGTGAIALWLAPFAAEVRGIEALPEAVGDARRNAAASGIGNARFYAGQAERLLPQWAAQGLRPDVVVVDPPRTGCDRRLLQATLRIRPRRFVYVSCNPSTLAKDCQVLLSGGYAIESAQPVDMFPQTAHVECCVSLIKR